MRYGFLDEAGDVGVGPRSSRVMVVAVVLTSSPQSLRRAVKFRTRLRKKKRQIPELKASQSPPAWNRSSDPASHPALQSFRTKPFIHRGDPRQAVSGDNRPRQGVRDGGEKRQVDGTPDQSSGTVEKGGWIIFEAKSAWYLRSKSSSMTILKNR